MRVPFGAFEPGSTDIETTNAVCVVARDCADKAAVREYLLCLGIALAEYVGNVNALLAAADDELYLAAYGDRGLLGQALRKT